MIIPKPVTLKKYGLTDAEWIMLYVRQGGTCAVCKKLPKSGRLVVDHEHVKGWKKMPPEQKKTFVRGLLCFSCNRFVVGRWGTLDKLRNAVMYLEDYYLDKKV